MPFLLTCFRDWGDMYSYFTSPVAIGQPTLVSYRYDARNFEPEVRSQDVIKVGDAIAIRHLLGDLIVVDVAKQLKARPGIAVRSLEKEEGSFVRSGERIAVRRGFLGLSRYEALAPVAGTLKANLVDDGSVVLRAMEKPETMVAYLPGRVTALDATGVTVETYARLVHGAVGTGGMASGVIHPVSAAMPLPRALSQIRESSPGSAASGPVLIFQHALTLEAALQCVPGAEGGAGVPVAAIVAPSMSYREYSELRVRAPGLVVVLTEGFGSAPMAEVIWRVLVAETDVDPGALTSGTFVGVDASTDLSLGRRPLVILPEEGQPITGPREHFPDAIPEGAAVRAMVGLQMQTGQVERVWQEPRVMPSGYRVEALDIRVAEGFTATVPVDDVEVLAE